MRLLPLGQGLWLKPGLTLSACEYDARVRAIDANLTRKHPPRDCIPILSKRHVSLCSWIMSVFLFQKYTSYMNTLLDNKSNYQ